MDLRDIDIHIPNNKSNDSVVINTEYWIANETNMIACVDKNGRVATNYITVVLGENIQSKEYKHLNIEEGDVLLISKFGAQVAETTSFQLPLSNIKYGNIHASQLIGKFNLGYVSLEALSPFTTYLICKEIKYSASSTIIRNDEYGTTTVGEIVKCTGKRYDKDNNILDSELKVGDKILLIDNVSTPIMINGENYICVPEERVIGKFMGDEYVMDNLDPLSNIIVIDEYASDKIEGFDLLYAPVEDLNFGDATSNYNRDKFRVIKVGSNIKELDANDIVYTNRDATNYIIINGKRYYTLYGMDFIDAKIKEGD